MVIVYSVCLFCYEQLPGVIESLLTGVCWIWLNLKMSSEVVSQCDPLGFSDIH